MLTSAKAISCVHLDDICCSILGLQAFLNEFEASILNKNNADQITGKLFTSLVFFVRLR